MPDVHYTFRIIVSFCSIHSDPLKRSKGRTAAARFAYQTCSVATDCFRHVDYRGDAPYHVGGGVLLPIGAPAEFADWEQFRSAAVSTETRKDAQEGRILDFALPRAVDRMLLLPLAAFALLPLVERGMAVRLDVECVEASDGKPNPHAHGWLSQRRLEQYGFGLKGREWNMLFLWDNGRYVRALIAGRLTLGCAVLGIDAYVDSRRNVAKGEGRPEERQPRWMFCARNEGRNVEAIEQLAKDRALKRKGKAPKQAPKPEEGSVIVTNAAMYFVLKKQVRELREKFADAAQQAGYEVRAQSGSPALALRGTSVTFDGCKFRIAATGSSEDAAIVARFVRELDWPALVVKGGARLADQVAIAGAAEGVFMVNRAPGASARDLIARAFYGELKAAIARHDPLGVAAKFLETFEANRTSMCEDAFTNSVSEDGLRSLANPMVPNTAPVPPRDVAEPASALAPIATGNERRVAAGEDATRAAASSSEAIGRMSGHRGENRPRLRVGGVSNSLPRSPADLRAPSSAPIEPSEVAYLASAVVPMAMPGNDRRLIATDGDARRTAASSSEATARMPGYRREAPRLPRVGVPSNNLPPSPAGVRVPGTAPFDRREVAGLASAVVPTSTSDNNSSGCAADADPRRTAGSSSEAFEGLEMLPEDVSWKINSDPIVPARKARELERGIRRPHHEDFDEFLRRKTRQSSGLRRDGINSPGSAEPRLPTRRPQSAPLWPAEIPDVSDQAVEAEEAEYQAPRL